MCITDYTYTTIVIIVTYLISYFFFFNDTATTEIYTFPYTTLFRSLVEAAIGRSSTQTRTCSAWFWRVRGDSSDRKSTRLNSSHGYISYAVFCLKKKKKIKTLSNQIK